jgi:hypothetical protein
MFGKRFVQHLRAGATNWQRGSNGWRAGAGSKGAAPQQVRNVAAAAGAAGQILTQLVQRAGLKLAGGAMVLGGGAGAFTVLTR